MSPDFDREIHNPPDPQSGSLLGLHTKNPRAAEGENEEAREIEERGTEAEKQKKQGNWIKTVLVNLPCDDDLLDIGLFAFGTVVVGHKQLPFYTLSNK